MKPKIVALTAIVQLFATCAVAQYLLANGTEVAPLEMFRECDVCPEMIALPVGEFSMGAQPDETRRNLHIEKSGKFRLATPDDPYLAFNEGPVHTVVIDLPFAMARNEVTRNEWKACVDDGACGGYMPEDLLVASDFERIKLTGTHPINNVSYLDAVSYTNWLNEKLGSDAYRLPTEAEWEYAARSGTQTPFAQGEEVTTDQVNALFLRSKDTSGEKQPSQIWRGYPVRVEELDATNAWGLRHMSGNVREITMSCWTTTHPGWSSSSLDLEMAKSVDCYKRVAKGGTYSFAMDYSRLASRGVGGVDWRIETGGFRVIRELNKN